MSMSEMSDSELCCVFFGMKKVKSLQIYHPKLRQAIYRRLAKSDSSLLFSLALPILQQGEQKIDAIDKKNWVKDAFENAQKLNISALLQCAVHSTYFNFYSTKITECLHEKIAEGQLKNLSVNELKKLLKYLSRIQDNHQIDIIMQELNNIADFNCQLTGKFFK